jgi:hypothetical protein
MTASKIRKHIMAGIRRRTQEFNKSTFPMERDEWTPEQKAIFAFLNGESGGFKDLHESDKPEIMKNLSRIAGIEDMKSRFSKTDEEITIPPYVVVVLRDRMGGYPANWPLVAGRISGLWTEEGTGASTPLIVKVSTIRPSTEDEIANIEKNFPENKLSKLYGAIDFASETDLREAITKAIIAHTARMKATFEPIFPEGITEKGKQILQLDPPEILRRAFSISLGDPAMLGTYKPAPQHVEFLPHCAIVHTQDTNGSIYTLGRVHVQADITPTDIFFTYPDEMETKIGNHAENTAEHLRIATDEEIQEYVKNLRSEDLHLYVSALNKDELNSLL